MKPLFNKKPHPARWLGWFLGGNILLLALLAQQYLLHGTTPESFSAAIYWILQSIGHFAFLGFVLYLPLLLIALILPFNRLVKILSIIAFSLLVILIQVDIQVFALYRFHFNAAIWEFLTTKGAAVETFVFDPINFIIAGGLIAAVVIVETGLAWLVSRRLERNRATRGKSIVAVILVLMLVGQGWHLIADAGRNSEILRMVSLIPWPKGVTAKRFLRKYGFNVAESEGQVASRSQMFYPRNPMQCGKPEKAYNILVILIDGLRYDMLNPEVMPNLSALKPESQVFNRHTSAGNSTRFGTFALFTGLAGNYWKTALRNNTGSILIDELIKQQYEIGIFRSARLTSPEFDRTIFSAIREQLPEFTPGDTVVDREIEITRQFTEFAAKKRSKPFMSLVFYDAPHAYVFPDDMELPFKPSLRRLNYLALNNDSDPLPFLNRYKNSVYFNDLLSADLIDALKKQGLYDDTIIMITGDHGKEFNETGLNYWGHNGNFSRYQVGVPLVVKWPGMEPREYDHSSSSLDVVPTLMQDLFRCSNPVTDYSNGRSLFNESKRDYLISSSWSRYSLIQPQQITVYHDIGNIDYYDAEYRPLQTSNSDPSVSLRMLEELSRFYKK